MLLRWSASDKSWQARAGVRAEPDHDRDDNYRCLITVFEPVVYLVATARNCLSRLKTRSTRLWSVYRSGLKAVGRPPREPLRARLPRTSSHSGMVRGIRRRRRQAARCRCTRWLPWRGRSSPGATSPKVSKTAPDVLLLAAQLLSVPSKRCRAYVDSDTGIAAALAAGMPVCNVRIRDYGDVSSISGFVKWDLSLGLAAILRVNKVRRAMPATGSVPDRPRYVSVRGIRRTMRSSVAW